jgi:hypothetical protein
MANPRLPSGSNAETEPFLSADGNSALGRRQDAPFERCDMSARVTPPRVQRGRISVIGKGNICGRHATGKEERLRR